VNFTAKQVNFTIKQVAFTASEVSLRRPALAKAQRDDRLLLRIHGTEKEMDREG
jgi:hypothetical protein